MAYTRKEFIEKIGPMAVADAKTSKILPSLTIAQAILESNNGNSTLTTEANALFGIKATSTWRGKVWNGKTIEYYGGKATTIVAGFKAYDSWAQSIADHSKLLTSNKRYSQVVGETDYQKACKAIAAAGYATDPKYADKLISIIEAYDLVHYDQPEIPQDVSALSQAVSKIIKAGIELDFNSWKREDLMKLENVPILLCKLAKLQVPSAVTEKQYEEAIKLLATQGIISEEQLWREKKYTVNVVSALLMKYAYLMK